MKQSQETYYELRTTNIGKRPVSPQKSSNRIMILIAILMFFCCLGGYRWKIEQLKKRHQLKIYMKHNRWVSRSPQYAHFGSDEASKLKSEKQDKINKAKEKAIDKTIGKYKDKYQSKFIEEVYKTYKKKAAENLKVVAKINDVQVKQLPLGYIESVNLHYHRLAQETAEKKFTVDELRKKLSDPNSKLSKELNSKVDKLTEQAVGTRIRLKKAKENYLAEQARKAKELAEEAARMAAEEAARIKRMAEEAARAAARAVEEQARRAKRIAEESARRAKEAAEYAAREAARRASEAAKKVVRVFSSWW
jgi:hypothetical protein